MTVCTVMGGGGYVGRNLVKHLARHGWDCRVPGRGDKTYLKDDLGVVFYCVGLTADFRTRPYETVEAHVGLLTDVLRNGRFSRLIYLSSTRVYLGAADTFEDQELCVQPGKGDDLYKLSKLMGESLALQSGHPCAVARLSNVVGGENGNPDSFVYSLLDDARRGRIVLRSDPRSAKDYIHVSDVVQLLHQLALGSRHKIYNLARGVQITHQQWTELLASVVGCDWTVQEGAEFQPQLPIHVERITREFQMPSCDVLQSCREEFASRTASTAASPDADS